MRSLPFQISKKKKKKGFWGLGNIFSRQFSLYFHYNSLPNTYIKIFDSF